MFSRPIPLLAIIFGAAVLQIANGVLGIIVPLRLGLADASSFGIGLVITAYSLGFLVGCFRSPAIIRDVGHIRAFAALAAISALGALLFVVTDRPALWAVLRFAGGFSAAGLYAVIESWVTDNAPDSGRGRLLAIYMVCNKAGLMLGQGLLALATAEGTGFFLLAGACTVFAIIPVSFTRTGGPPTRDVATLSFIQLYRIAPMGVVGCFTAGLVNPSMLGLAPIYGLGIGLDARHIPLLVVAAQLGTFALQWPLGWFSDRVDRRTVIVLATGGSAAVALVLAVAGNLGLPVLLALFLLWGGCALSVYAVCVVHAGDHVDHNQFVPLVSSLMLAWAIGASIGPPLATLSMSVFGTAGLMYFVAAVSGVLAVFALWRMTRRGPVAVAEREAFVNIPASGPGVADLAADLIVDADDEAAEDAKKADGTA